MSVIETFQTIEDQDKELNLINSIASFKREALHTVATARIYQVSSPDTAKEAVRICGSIKDLAKNIDKARKAITEPYRNFINKINDIARELTDPLDEVETLLNGKIGAWKKAETAALVTENEATQALMASLGVEIDAIKVEAPKNIRAEGAVSYEKTVWYCEVIDETLVPREYLIVDESKLKYAMKAGIRNIPGVRIYSQQQTLIRSR